MITTTGRSENGACSETGVRWISVVFAPDEHAVPVQIGRMEFLETHGTARRAVVPSGGRRDVMVWITQTHPGEAARPAGRLGSLVCSRGEN